MAWNFAGLVLSLAVALFALTRSRLPGGYYDADVYGMTSSVHRRYALIAFAFALAFAVASFTRAGTIGLWVFAAFVIFALFYLTSFLRGAHEDDD